MNNNLNFVKSKYPIKKINVVILMIYCVVLFVGIAGWRIYLSQSVPKNYVLLFVYITTLIYYIGMFKNKENEFENMKYISGHAKKCMFKMKRCLFLEAILIIIVMIFVVIPSGIRDGDLYNLSLLFFIFITGYMLMNYQFVVGFGTEYYVSGDGKLSYNEIKGIEEIKRIEAFEGTLVYAKIILVSDKICYDKFLIDEYTYLINMINKER